MWVPVLKIILAFLFLKRKINWKDCERVLAWSSFVFFIFHLNSTKLPIKMVPCSLFIKKQTLINDGDYNNNNNTNKKLHNGPP